MEENQTVEEEESEENQTVEEEESEEKKENVKNEEGIKEENKKNKEELIGKLDDLVNKKNERIVKSILKDNGIVDEKEIEEILNTYKGKQKSLQEENAKLKETISTTQLNSMVKEISSELGISSKNIEYVKKLADLTNAKDDNGQYVQESIKKAIEQVVNDIPALIEKKQINKEQIKSFGAEKKTPDDTTSYEKIRRVMGLK